MTDIPRVRSPADMPTPLYHQVQLVLRERIEQGFYAAKGLIPAEIELAREFEVSRITVARAINELAQQGLVTRRRGAGTRIVTRGSAASAHEKNGGIVENLVDLENLADIGTRTRARVLEFGFVLPPNDCQLELKISKDERVQRVVRLRSYNSEPFCYLTSFVPADIGARFSEEDLNLLSLMSLFERSGIRIGGARQSFSAALADPKIAQSLGVAVGTPLLAITRTVFDDNTRPVKFIRILYRTDRYQYRMTMERDSKPSSRYRTTLAALDDDLAG